LQHEVKVTPTPAELRPRSFPGTWDATLNYDASDNVGVHNAEADVAGQAGGSQQRSCALATLERAVKNYIQGARLAPAT
jgi:hypothetical protein